MTANDRPIDPGKSLFEVSSANSPKASDSRKLHLVSRGEALPRYDGVSEDQDIIEGYDASLMRDRNALSAAEEKKLLRRIDWRLLPLLAIMYIVKTMDAANVSLLISKPHRHSDYSNDDLRLM
jgi:hypothetical protein